MILFAHGLDGEKTWIMLNGMTAKRMQRPADAVSVRHIAPKQLTTPPAAVKTFQHLKEGQKLGAPPALRAHVAKHRVLKVSKVLMVTS